MFKINDCFKESGIFNEILIRRFDENFNPHKGSRLWMTPGHVIFTTSDSKINTCDARPYDFSSSPSEQDSDELIIAHSPVLEIVFDTQSSSSTRMFVILTNGDIQIFEYRILLFEWARIGYFNVNIVSPNTNDNHHIIVQKILISHSRNMIYWSEKTGSDMGCNLNRREVPLSGVREITQSAIGVPQKLFKNCPNFDLVEVGDNVCIIPHLPNCVNVYLIVSARLHVWFFNINGKCLWRSVIGDGPLDFIALCTKTIGLWTCGGTLKVCELLDSRKRCAFVMHNDKLLSITSTGEINTRSHIEIHNNLGNCFIMKCMLYAFTSDLTFLHMFNINSGEHVQTFDLSDYAPINGMWHHSSDIPSLGFYSNDMIYKINYQSLTSLLLSDTHNLKHALEVLKNEHFHLFALIKDLLNNNFAQSSIKPLNRMPTVFQSEALLLAILQSCREEGLKAKDFPVKTSEIEKIQGSTNGCKTKLNELLQPLVECFVKIEKCRTMQYKTNKNLVDKSTTE